MNALISNLVKRGYEVVFYPTNNSDTPFGVALKNGGKELSGVGTDLTEAFVDVLVDPWEREVDEGE